MFWVKARGPQQKREIHFLEQVQCKTVEKMKLLEHLWHELSMRKLGDFRLECSHENLINMYKYLMGEARLFLMVSSDRARLSGHKVKHRQFHPNIRKKIGLYIFFFLVIVVSHWKLHMQVVESVSLEVSGTSLINLLWVTLL